MCYLGRGDFLVEIPKKILELRHGHRVKDCTDQTKKATLLLVSGLHFYNDMFRTSRRLAQAAEYISRHEFLDALVKVCPAAASSKHNGGLPLGENCNRRTLPTHARSDWFE